MVLQSPQIKNIQYCITPSSQAQVAKRCWKNTIRLISKGGESFDY